MSLSVLDLQGLVEDPISKNVDHHSNHSKDCDHSGFTSSFSLLLCIL